MACLASVVLRPFTKQTLIWQNLWAWLSSFSRPSGSSCCIIRWFVSNLQISLVGEHSSAIAMLFDGMFGEFAFSWKLQNYFVILRHDIKLSLKKYLCTGLKLWIRTTLYHKFVRHWSWCRGNIFTPGRESYWEFVKQRVWELKLGVGNRQLF